MGLDKRFFLKFWCHSWDVFTLFPNNYKFLLCLSVLQLAYFLTPISYRLISILYLSLLCFFTHLLKFYSGGVVDLWSCFHIFRAILSCHLPKICAGAENITRGPQKLSQISYIVT